MLRSNSPTTRTNVSPPEMMATRAMLLSTSSRLLAVGKTVGRKAEKTMTMPNRKSSVPYLPMKRRMVRVAWPVAADEPGGGAACVVIDILPCYGASAMSP